MTLNVDYEEMNSNLIIGEDEIEINDVSVNVNEIEVT